MKKVIYSSEEDDSPPKRDKKRTPAKSPRSKKMGKSKVQERITQKNTQKGKDKGKDKDKSKSKSKGKVPQNKIAQSCDDKQAKKKAKDCRDEKKKDFMPGQKYPTPEDDDGARAFYCSLLSQNSKSDMARRYCLQHGLAGSLEESAQMLKEMKK